MCVAVAAAPPSGSSSLSISFNANWLVTPKHQIKKRYGSQMYTKQAKTFRRSCHTLTIIIIIIITYERAKCYYYHHHRHGDNFKLILLGSPMIKHT